MKHSLEGKDAKIAQNINPWNVFRHLKLQAHAPAPGADELMALDVELPVLCGCSRHNFEALIQNCLLTLKLSAGASEVFVRSIWRKLT